MEIKPYLRAVSDQTEEEKKPLERNARKLFCIINGKEKLFPAEDEKFPWLAFWWSISKEKQKKMKNLI